MAGERSRERRRALAAAVLVALATAAVFGRCLENGFIEFGDDGPTVLHNEEIRGLDRARLEWMFTTFHMGHYQPLAWLSLAIDHALWGLDPTGFHGTSVLLHVASALLVFALARRLLPGAGNVWACALAACLFALHPLRVESVAWITERRDVLSASLFLASLVAYTKAVDPSSRSRASWWAAALALAIATSFTKAIGALLPGVMLILDAFVLRRLGPGRTARVLAEKIPFLVVAVALGRVALLAQESAGAAADWAHLDLAQRAHIALRALAFYPLKTAWPVDLAPQYEIPSGGFPWDAESFAALAIVAAGAAAAAACWRRCPSVTAALGAYALLVLPVSGFFQSGLQFAADRYSYLACAGLALLAGAGAFRARGAIARWLPGLGWTLAAVLAVLAWRQIGLWKDDWTLWSAAVERSPGASIAWTNRAAAARARGALELAEADLRRAVSVRPDGALMLANLARFLSKRGRPAEAEPFARRLCEVSPRSAASFVLLAQVQVEQGRAGDAVLPLERALEIEPRDLPARLNLAKALLSTGEAARALRELEIAAEIAPGETLVQELQAEARSKLDAQEPSSR